MNAARPQAPAPHPPTSPVEFQNTYFGGRHAATSRDALYGPRSIDFKAVAHAFGVRGSRISDLADLDIDVAYRLPEVFDIVIHESHGIQPKLEFGNALENMSPFCESAAEMIVPPAPRVSASGWVKL